MKGAKKRLRKGARKIAETLLAIKKKRIDLERVFWNGSVKSSGGLCK